MKKTVIEKDSRLTVSNALLQLQDETAPFKTLFQHGSLHVEIYKPEKIDLQQPHTRDEIYVVASGSGFFVNDAVKKNCEVGEVLFVAAGIEHRFEDFTSDFSVWVFFYGPEGGEKE